MYYKIKQNGKVIDVVCNPSFVKFLASGHIAITDKSSAQGIVGSDMATIYSFGVESKFSKATVTISEVCVNEFNRLNGLLNSDNKLSKEEKELHAAQNVKIAELSNICNAKITAGFSVRLKDKNIYSFKLTTNDQINLLNLENQLNTGADTFIYHSTDCPCRVFNRDDMKKIIKSYREHVLYHTTYFNVAKQYVKSLAELAKVNAFTYGSDITWFTKESAIKQILKNGVAN